MLKHLGPSPLNSISDSSEFCRPLVQIRFESVKICCNYQQSAYFAPLFSFIWTHFRPMLLFYTPWKRQKTFVFWRFQGVQKWNMSYKKIDIFQHSVTIAVYKETDISIWINKQCEESENSWTHSVKKSKSQLRSYGSKFWNFQLKDSGIFVSKRKRIYDIATMQRVRKFE